MWTLAGGNAAACSAFRGAAMTAAADAAVDFPLIDGAESPNEDHDDFPVAFPPSPVAAPVVAAG
jgi:hypothetical protein